MKRYLIFIIVILISGCDDTISLYDNFEEQIVINAPIDLDSTTQRLRILKTFPKEKKDEPLENFLIKGAEVTLTDEKNTFSYKFDPIENIYKCENFKNIPGTDYTLNVKLPDNREYRSSIKAPNRFEFLMIKSSTQIPDPEDKNLFYTWRYTNSKNEIIAFAPIMAIKYTLKSENDSIIHLFHIPKDIIYIDGKRNLIYGNITKTDFSYFYKNIIEQSFEIIGEVYSDKTEVKILGAYFSLHILEKNLAKYYSSVNRQDKGYTLLLNQIEFSNFSNALGIFGAYFSHTINIYVANYYIERYGYRHN